MDHRRGMVSAIAAFGLWGFLPLFWKQLEHLHSLTIVCHRTLWGLPLLWMILTIRHRWRGVSMALRSPRLIGLHMLSGSLLAANWLLYIWSTNHERMLEGALGYYLNPFFNMLFGFLWFGERHNRIQLAAIGLAISGAALQFPAVEGWPWVAICLAITFSLYGVIRKRSSLDTLEGLALETSLIAPVALAWITLRNQRSTMPTDHLASSIAVLSGMGAATILPLLCFGHAARNLQLSTLGILQFIGPSIQFMIAWQLYHEPMPGWRIASFALIWMAVLVYMTDMRRKLQD